jgi:hypothetical protein
VYLGIERAQRKNIAHGLLGKIRAERPVANTVVEFTRRIR